MGGKAKPTKHTAKEIKGKAFEATVNRGGGASGLQDRKGGAAGHAKFECPHCGMAAPSIKNMEAHHESKHPKLPWDESIYVDKHEVHGGTTKGVAVRGSIYK